MENLERNMIEKTTHRKTLCEIDGCFDIVDLKGNVRESVKIVKQIETIEKGLTK